VPPGERLGHIFTSLLVLEQHRHASPVPVTSDRLAWAAVRQLLDAYARGEEEGGSIDWDDLDLAHELACDAVAAPSPGVPAGPFPERITRRIHPQPLALEAAELLVEAYRRGKRRGGDVDWSDVDIAHELARRAVAEVRWSTRRHEGAACESARAEMRALARYFVAIANPDYGAYDLREALANACTLAGLVLGFDRVSRTAERGRALERSAEGTCEADNALGRLRAIAARLVDDDDHHCDLTEELEAACEMATIFQELDTALSDGAPVPKAWGSGRR